ncbi:hypothetical protein F4781DRAFT_382020 [Annulohypoxylon bovei var. microspora]|nr:hypothetical protein F4781DRAFT_382020 [Annulohypoxylon bovei var. microspora]
MYNNTYPPPPPPTESNPPPPPPPSYGYERYDRPSQPSYPPPTDGPSQQWNDHYAQQDHRDEYQFRGPYSDLRRNHSDDRRRIDGDYRDRDRNRDRNHDRDRDNYRPPQGDFTFRVEAPPGVEPYDSYRPREREWDQRASRTYGEYSHQERAQHTYSSRNSYSDERVAPHQSRRDENDRQAGRNGRSRRIDDRRNPHYSHQSQQATRPGRRGNYKEKTKPSARLLLLKKHDENPELMLGDTEGRATYRDVDDLSNSDETEMDISDNSDNSDTDVAEPASKRVRTSIATTKAEQEAPRWSNPDPYTALPPPDESSRKKKDMVQLIRKARVEAEAKKPAAQIEGLDFISCDFDDNDDKGGEDGHKRFSRESINKTDAKVSTLRTLRDLRGATATATLPPKPSILPPSVETRQGTVNSTHPNSYGNKENPIDLTASSSLGNRKRTFDDTIKSYPSFPKSSSTSFKSGNKMTSAEVLLPSWQPRDKPCPWFNPDNVEALGPSTRLHKEIIDFYLWVRPRDFEERAREDMIISLRKLIQNKWPDVDLYPFGSYMSGMYLPTADMDIAICSDSYLDGGVPKFSKKNHLFILQAFLKKNGVPQNDSVEVISKAKVPLVKYTDSRTFLKVDISFEKIDGRRAIQTFLTWKEKYPAMPIIVSLVKQFLLMRGLNEPVSGGIGGFSIMCMVVHVLDQLPQVQSGNMIAEYYLGDMLMEFFDYFGNHFQYKTLAIRVNPPGVIPKTEVTGVGYRNMDRLSIIDPNNSANDVSGGSHNTPAILNCFAEAYAIIKHRMSEVANDKALDDRFGSSILGPLFGGDYSSFETQRTRLYQISKEQKPITEPYNWVGEW